MANLSSYPLFLVADIGGTNTRVGLIRGATILPDSVTRFRNASHGGLADVLKLYLADKGVSDCQGACVAVAGPVHDGYATLTNLDWTLDIETLAGAVGTRNVALVNDLQAQGYALPLLPESSCATILEATSEPHSRTKTRLVVGVGTGFNVACVHPVSHTRSLVPPAESGHVLLPTRCDRDRALVDHLLTLHEFISVEDVLSGRGLERVYRYHAQNSGAEELPAAEIMAALGKGEPIARATAEDMLRILGMVTGDLALTHLPFGGIYLVGGVARAFEPYLTGETFSNAFKDKGRFSQFMDQFAIRMVLDDYAALSGAGAYLSQGKAT